MVAVDVKEMVLSVVVVMVEERRRFREPRSTFNHLRSITSAEVMAAFSCRGRTGMVRSSSPLYGAYSPFLFVSLSLSLSLFHSSRLSSRLWRWSLLLSTLYPAIAFEVSLGELSKFARDCAPFEVHLIDQVLMKMIP